MFLQHPVTMEIVAAKNNELNTAEFPKWTLISMLSIIKFKEIKIRI